MPHSEGKTVQRSSVEDLLPIPRASQVLGLAERTMRGLITSGSLPCIRIGRRVLIDPADLRRFIAERRSRSKRGDAC